jgi:hypothetical protein
MKRSSIMAALAAARYGRAPTLRQMLHVFRQAHPRVFAFLVDRERRCGKIGVRERADRDGNMVLWTLDCVVNRCAAIRTEIERNPGPRIADAYILSCLSADSYAFPAKARLSTEDAAGSTLTGKTVTNGHANRVFDRGQCELPTTAGCNSCGHGVTVVNPESAAPRDWPTVPVTPASRGSTSPPGSLQVFLPE